MNIGVLALQGDFLEHQKMLEQLGARVIQVRLPQHLQDLDGLIIPGGESTTIGKLAVDFGLLEPLRAFARDHAVWGTCAGAIFLARNIGLDQPLLGVMDITVERNAFGRQVDSFATDLDVPVLKEVDPDNRPFRAVFIRAPRIAKANGTTRMLASLPDGTIVAVRQNRWLATSFHPELTGDDRFHRYFMEMAQSKLDL
jgi:5'-phosphate synthase pdxT subunit